MLQEFSDTGHEGNSRAGFARFMLAQIQTMEKYRQTLSRRSGKEITSEQAAFMWIERGYAAAFRQRFDPLNPAIALNSN